MSYLNLSFIHEIIYLAEHRTGWGNTQNRG